MNKGYSDSIFPFGIGTSFLVVFGVLMTSAAVTGFFLNERYGDMRGGGGIILLVIFLVMLVGPVIHYRKRSRYEKDKVVLKRYDGIGVIQGLRGALFRLLVYEDGVEIRAFYHRYYIPFSEINRVSIEEGHFNVRLNIATVIDGIPDHIISSGKQFMSMAVLIEKKAGTGSERPILQQRSFR